MPETKVLFNFCESDLIDKLLRCQAEAERKNKSSVAEKNKESEVSRYKRIINLYLYDDNNGRLTDEEIDQLARRLLSDNQF